MTNKSKIAKAALGLLAGAVMFAGVTVSAMTQSQAQALVASLGITGASATALVTALTTTTDGSSTGTMTSGSCFTFSNNLALGANSSDVMQLQKVLNSDAATALAVTAGTTGSTGHEGNRFGPATKAAVIKFQTKHNISPASGNVFALTRAALNAMCTTSTGTTTGGTTTGGTTTGGTTTTSSGPVSVMLASDTPVAGTIIAGQATADLAHFTVSGNGTLNSVTLQRTGISDQNTLTNVYLYNGMTRLTDGYSFNTAGTLTMSNLGIAVNGTMTLSVRADVWGSTSNTAYSIGVNMTSYTAAGGSATAVNLVGNTMFVAAGTSMPSASFNANTVAVSSAPSVNPGTTGYTLWSAPVQINTRSLWLKSANYRIIGSAPSDALANVTLYKDGVAIAGVATLQNISGSEYAVFDFSASPVELTTGTHTIDVRADVVKGSARTIQLSIQQAADLMLYDSQTMTNVAATFAANSKTTVYAINIAQGTATISIDPTFQTMTKVTGGASNVAIARFKLHAYGEDVKVDTLTILPYASCVSSCGSGATSTLQNVTVYFNGSSIGSQTSNWTSGNIVLTPGAQMIVPAGQDSTLEVRADLRSTNGVNYTGGTVYASIVGASGNAEGMNSHNTLTLNSSNVTGNSLTMQTGLLAVGKNTNYGNQIMSANTGNSKIGSFTLQNQSTSESVHVTSLRVSETFAVPTYTSGTVTSGSQAINVSSSAGFSVGDVITIPGATSTVGSVTAINSSTQIQVNVTTAGATPTVGGAIANASKTATAVTYVNALRTSESSGNGAQAISPTGIDTFSVDFTLAPGASKVIDVMSDLGAANYGTIQTSLAVQGLGSTSNVSVYSNGATSLTDVTGQTITMATGSVPAPTLITSASTQAQYIASASGSTNGTTVSYKFVAANGAANVNELKFTVAGPVTSVSVNGQTGNVVAGAVDITGVNLAVANTTTGVTVPVYVSYGSVAPAANGGIAVSGATSSIVMTEVDYTVGSAAQQTISTGLSGTASPVMYLVGAKPSLAVTTTSNAGLTNGENKLIDVTLTPVGGTVGLNQIAFTVNFAGTGTSSLTSLRIADNSGASITDFGTSGSCTAYTGTNLATSTTIITAGTPVYVKCADTDITDTNGYLLTDAKTFSLFGTLGINTMGTAGASSITTSLEQGAAGMQNFAWTDVSGGGVSGAETGAGHNDTYFYGFPTQTWSVHN